MRPSCGLLAPMARHKQCKLALLVLVASMLLAQPSGVLAQTTTPSVTALLGKINGMYCPGTNNTVVKFLGIPFAKPPTGSLRWSAPQPYTRLYPERGLKATEAGAWCIQTLDSTGMNDGAQTTSENCLYLNVWAPASATPSSRLPVRFWIHGGAFLTGSGAWSQYDACQVCKDANVIQVTINYRLGALGYLAAPEFRDKKGYPAGSKGTTGNWGLLDQRMALKWVQANIAAFGGDPKKVLIHGQSAGAFSVFNQMITPGSSGLFSAAISESGSPDYMGVYPLEDAYMFGDLLKTAVGCNATQALSQGYKSVRGCMLDQNATYINEQTSKMPSLVSFKPTIDGVEYTTDPLTLMKQGAFNKVPFMIGANPTEGAVFISGFFENVPGVSILSGYINQTMFLKYIDAKLIIPTKFEKRVLLQYNASNYGGSWIKALTALVSESKYQCPSHRGARFWSAKKVPTWMYEFIQPEPLLPGCWLQNGFAGLKNYVQYFANYLNSTHTAEIPHVFMLPYATSTINSNCNYTSQEKALAPFVSGVWNSMASSGKPLPALSKLLSGSQYTNATWPQYNTKTRQALYLASNPVPFKWDMTTQCKVWDDINAYIFKVGTNFN